jgi:hypothetical protein
MRLREFRGLAFKSVFDGLAFQHYLTIMIIPLTNINMYF